MISGNCNFRGSDHLRCPELVNHPRAQMAPSRPSFERLTSGGCPPISCAVYSCRLLFSPLVESPALDYKYIFLLTNVSPPSIEMGGVDTDLHNWDEEILDIRPIIAN
jgi:hypothetical protein